MKRLISLLLTLVMVLAMLPASVGAADADALDACGPAGFKDADRISYADAVAITAGIGLFAGKSDGRFDPSGKVTRAQMATVVVKMLKGGDFNADAYKGKSNPFSDTAGFEGGWAEGYINACRELGVVSGYPDGTFHPEKEVTAAEALTMVINALKVDAGAGEWPTTVMNKASEMKLYDELKTAPAADTVLDREELAVVVNAGVQYKPASGESLLSSVFGVKKINTEHKYDEKTKLCTVCRAAMPGVLTRADLEQAVVEVAWAYFMKGVKLQYCSQELDKVGKFHGGHYRITEDGAPEYGTVDTTVYAVCSDYVYKTYLEAIGHRLFGSPRSLQAITFDMWRRCENQPDLTTSYKSGSVDPVDENDVDYCVMRWKSSGTAAFDSVAKSMGVPTSPYFANFGDYHFTFENGYYPSTEEEQAAQTAAAREFLLDWEKNLRPGDVFCSSGHAMLYVGNGYILDCTTFSSLGGGKYDLAKGVDKIEPNGSVSRLSTMEWLVGWIFNEAKRDWFTVIRPTNGMVTDDGDGNLANDLVKPDFTIPAKSLSREQFPAMEIDRTASVKPYHSVVSGEEVVYSVKITNKTTDELYQKFYSVGGIHQPPTDYKGVTVTETVPEGTKFISATGEYAKDGDTLVWTVDVPAGQTVEVTYTVEVDAAMGSTVVNDGGLVASIPSNTLTHRVGGSKLSAQALSALTAIADTDPAQWREKFNISANTTDLDFAERIYQKMGVDLDLPTLTDLVKNLFPWTLQVQKSSHYNYSDKAAVNTFTVTDAPAAEYQKYRDMLVDGYWGGYLYYTGTDKIGTTINELRIEYLEPGDVLVYVTSAANGEPLVAGILVYAGLNSAGEPAVLEADSGTQTLTLHTAQAARDRIWNAFMPKIKLFFALRPSQALEDVNAARFDAAKEPVYGAEPVAAARPTELGATALPQACLKVLKSLKVGDVFGLKIKFAYAVYAAIGIDGLDKVMLSASNSAISSATAAVATAFQSDGGKDPNRVYKVRDDYPTTPGKMYLRGFYSGTWLPKTGKVPTLADLLPGDIVLLGSRGLDEKGTATADEYAAVYQGDGKFILTGFYGYDRTGDFGPITEGYVYGDLDFSGEKPTGEFNLGGSSTKLGKVTRTVNDLTQTDEKYGYVKIDSFADFFTHDPCTGKEHAFAFVLRPTQGVYDICDPGYVPNAASSAEDEAG